MTRQEIVGGTTAAQSTRAQRLAGLLLVRIATGTGGESEIGRDLHAFVPHRTTAQIWQIELTQMVSALVAGGLIERLGDTLSATAAGVVAATEFLRLTKGLPATWAAARDVALLAVALDLEAPAEKRHKLLSKADGLRALIVVRHWNLQLKGPLSPSRVRSALAVRALERAFGNTVSSGIGDRSSLPAKAGRLLAGQLAAAPRDFGTDTRLVAALAAEAVAAHKPDFKNLRLALLRGYFGELTQASPAKPRWPRNAARKGKAGTNLRRAAPNPRPGNDVPTGAPPPPLTEIPLASRPDPQRFATAVNAAAASVAEGWSGNRRAFVSRVWATLLDRHPEWALTDIEFKCMLAEAHRTGLVALSNADLKDKKDLEFLQDSAVVYKNTVWHYVRVLE